MEELYKMIRPSIDQYLNMTFDWKMIYLSPPGLIPPWLSFLVRLDSPSTDPLHPLMFPSLSSSSQRHFGSPLYTIFGAIGILPRTFNTVKVNLSICLTLPLSALTIPSPDAPSYPLAWRDL
ncbi:hypothetical protein CLU79DRAFT_849288 [Phycomyces nitens]|nr:hypothetical protein CLU79DRAFT_849288 [Phycomyces nitens]